MIPEAGRWSAALEPALVDRLEGRVQDYGEALLKLERMHGHKPLVGIACREREEWLSAWLAVLQCGTSVFLANPDWKTAAWTEVARQVSPDCVFGNWEASTTGKQTASPLPGYWFIPTGGTGGRIKFIGHTSKTFGEAARAFSEVCGGQSVHSLSFLPLHHVSGLMPWARAAYTGGRVRFADWSAVRTGAFPESVDWPEQLSLVPTQLMRLLESEDACDWLKTFAHVLVGGAACSEELVCRARRRGVPVAPCYGMTETAAFIAWQPHNSQVCRDSVVATAAELLPHVSVTLADDGEILLDAASLAEGVWKSGCGMESLPRPYPTGDIGAIDGDGYLLLTGRKDRVINTGGEKVSAERVESVLSAYPAVADVVVVGVPDAQWGQRVAALVVLSVRGGQEMEALKAYAASQLERAAVPKQWVFAEAIPRQSNEKIDFGGVLGLLSSVTHQ